jgi:hypothetical protein
MGHVGSGDGLEPLSFYMDHRKADLPAGDPPPLNELSQALFDPKKDGVPLSWRIENVLMVAAGIRGSSMFHPRSERDVLAIRELARACGVGMAVRRAGKRVLKVFLFGELKEEFASSIPDIDESMGDMEFIAAQIGLANMTGHFLDFPQCCTASFVQHLMDCADQDEEAMRMLRAETDPDSRAYFVERFVPCSPRCPAAIAEGRRIEEALRERAPGILQIYGKLRMEHMDDVREGRIIAEKRRRDGSN